MNPQLPLESLFSRNAADFENIINAGSPLLSEPGIDYPLPDDLISHPLLAEQSDLPLLAVEPIPEYHSHGKQWHGEDASQFFHRLHHHASRRAAFHDYKNRGAYLITISKGGTTPPLSKIIGNLGAATNISTPLHIHKSNFSPDLNELSPRLLLTDSGAVAAAQITLFLQEHPEFDIPYYAIMPDHIHLLWTVKQYLPRELGHYITRFKTLCTLAWCGPGTGDSTLSTGQQHRDSHRSTENAFFAEKFNDKIAFSDEIYWRFAGYIIDNPRRRLMAMTHPEFFSRTIRIEINGMKFDAYGNFNLLRHPMISAAVISSRDSSEHKGRQRLEWAEITRAGGVLISPFISAAEKDVMQTGIAGNASIIRLITDGLPPRYKPSGQEFDLCSQGRLLHIGIPKECTSNIKLKREVALHFNSIAKALAAMPPTARMNIKGGA